MTEEMTWAEYLALTRKGNRATDKKDLEDTLASHIRSLGLPEPEREYQFHPTRKWRFDFAWPSKMIAVEVEGGIWSGGRHTRGAGFVADCEKYNAAAELGWRVFRYPGGIVKNGEAVNQIERILEQSESN